MKRRILRATAVFLAINMLAEIIAPTAAFALSGGPSQPEVQSFEPVGTTEMVDLFSGDFVYNIPLMDVEGYPINIAYHSGITMDQEASWVGLGWNINPGVINRNMRGLPDDFKDDEIKKDLFIKSNNTYGCSFGASLELFGVKMKKVKGNLSFAVGVFYNNYRGIGFERTVSTSVSAGQTLKLNSALAISSNTQSGMSISPSTGLSLGKKISKADYNGGVSFSVGASFNSRSGIKTLTFSKGLSFKKDNEKNAEGKEIQSIGSGGNNGGSSVSYAGESYTPQISMPMTSANATFSAKLGTSAFGADGSWDIKGYFSSQYIKQDKQTVTKGGYGYLYASEARDKDDVLLDLNREKDGSYSQANPNLPLTTFTHDLYAVSGQGIGGMFRPYRSDIGQVHDDVMESGGAGGAGGFELGAGTIAKWGVDAVYNYSGSESHKWYAHNGNNLADRFRFKADKEGNDPSFEPVYFKSAGEKTQAETDFMPYKNLSEAVRPAFLTFNNVSGEKLSESIRGDFLIRTDGNEMEDDPQKLKGLPVSNTYKTKREPRNQQINYIRADEYNLCTEPGEIKSYKLDKKYPFDASSYNNVSRLDNTRKGHHITEISTVNPQGSRYIYGIAAYNKKQEEITFTTLQPTSGDPLNTARLTGLVGYSQSYYDQKKGEEDGASDGFYSATTLPGYAHSYLLTAVLSPDYVDRTDNGLTEDDYGNYTKINYSRTTDQYKWRTPYDEDKAMYHEALRSDQSDDKGSLIYGEKEQWYVHSIETKNYIAEFKLFRRQDAVGVKDVHGGRETNGSTETQYSYGLESISLFTKAEKMANGAGAVPIKVVHFEYTYDLCQDIQNNTHQLVAGTGPFQGGLSDINNHHGKLTLKRIYFTYGNSNKGKLSSYEFNYGSNNPNYDVKAYDRWGNYKPNKPYNSSDPFLAATNAEFPYTDQGKTGGEYNADLLADAWSLKEIKLPSGGKIQITYEADDYAYVQDKRAMQMYGIRGFSQYGDVNAVTHSLYGENESSRKYGNNWVHVQIPEGCEGVTQFARNYIPDPYKPWDNTRYLFFNFLTSIRKDEDRREYVRGYAEIDYNEDPQQYIIRCSDTEYAIKVKKVLSEDTETLSYSTDASPFAKAAWQYFRMALPQEVYPGANVKKTGANFETIIRSLLGNIFDAYEYIQGINDAMLKKGFGRGVQTSRCWVRLKNGTGFKKGGGVRVKKLQLLDGWAGMTGNAETESSYGQEYDYTVKLPDGTRVSSGVASYEPMIGNEENPFRLPVMTSKENSLIPDESFYVEEPFGESFFPSATVGYSTVTVKNLTRPGVTRHATGKVVNEFYTTKDFPTLTARTNTQTHKKKPNWITGLAAFKIKNHVTAVQGYLVELNDMNGKPKAEWVYAENMEDPQKDGKLISGMSYVYKTDPGNPHHLNNHVTVALPGGTLNENAEVLVGVDADMILDTREETSTSGSFGVELNTDLIFAGIFAIPVPVPIPSYSSDETRFRSAVITRVIQRYGILEKTIAYADGAAISTENLVFDAQTGEVLLTQTKNEYKDDVFNLTYPAHWVHEGMSQAYHNSGITLNINLGAATALAPETGGYATLGDNGNIPPGANIRTYLKEGDEIKVDDVRYWYTDDGYFMDREGNTLNRTEMSVRNLNVKVIRTSRRNMQSTPLANVVSRKNPIHEGTPRSLFIEYLDPTKQVINASAAYYNDEWRNYCETSSELIANRADFNANECIDALNYFFKKGFMGTTIVGPATTVPITSETSPEYDAYAQSFVKETFDYCGISEQLEYTYGIAIDSNSAETKAWFIDLPTCNKYEGTWGGKLRLGVSIPIDACNTESAYPERIEYIGNTLVYTPTQVYGSVMFRAYFPGGCYADGWVQIEGDTYRYGAVGAECVSKRPEANNPFAINERGAWRKKRDLVFLTNRKELGNSSDIRKDGVFENFQLNANTIFQYGNRQNPDPYWQFTTESTQYIPEGFEVETRDALDRYNSVLYETDLLPVAVANNAERREIGSDGFEYYPEVFAIGGCFEKHWHFKNSPTEYDIDATVSHTGIKSMKLLAGQQASNSYFTKGCGSYAEMMSNTCNSCLLPFTPYPGRAYVVSGWVKTNPASAQGNIDNRDVNVVVTFNNATQPQVINITPSGPIIEGWQRFEHKINIPEEAFTINVTLKASATQTTWYDDVRIYPVNGNMKSYVYSPTTHRLMAELDENNYATFYEYDEQGALKRVKKETERGIMTIKESRNHTSK